MTPVWLDSISALPAADWDALNRHDSPFLCHGFLSALEASGAVGADSGWQACPLILQQDGRLQAALPLYRKSHSFGEFVFDWSWADAYRRHGLDYYPKLVAAVPYTPVTGPRLLLHPDADPQCADTLVDAATDLARQQALSSLHVLFIPPAQQALLVEHGYLPRYGCQFHWFNRGYDSFDAFLAALTSRQRKKVRRERRAIGAQGLTVHTLTGSRASAAQWRAFYHFYRATFAKKGNIAMLDESFFTAIGRSLGERVLLVLAEWQGRPVAGSLFLRDRTTLYGRYWGCTREFDALHFELCYYRGIEYCIEQGLSRFEAGAQGEHKLARGFEPVLTRSAHWIAEPQFRTAIADFLRHEEQGIQRYIQAMRDHLPYKDESIAHHAATAHPPAILD